VATLVLYVVCVLYKGIQKSFNNTQEISLSK
jgi:hypothetical protein